MQEINVGDTVMLKSGGPDMTAIALQNGEWLCRWLRADGTEDKNTFSPHELTHSLPVSLARSS